MSYWICKQSYDGNIVEGWYGPYSTQIDADAEARRVSHLPSPIGGGIVTVVEGECGALGRVVSEWLRNQLVPPDYPAMTIPHEVQSTRYPY